MKIDGYTIELRPDGAAIIGDSGGLHMATKSELALIAAIADLQKRLDACFEDAEIALASKEAEVIERCAKVCDDRVQDHDNYTAADHEAEGCADAIRALGKGS